METKKNRTKVLVCVLALVALVLFSLSGYAGKLEPNSPPGPTMKTLQEIYDAASGGIVEREGYTNHVLVNPSSTEDLVPVPAEKRFVLLKLFVFYTTGGVSHQWNLVTGSGRTILSGHIASTGTGGGTFMCDFPDRCIIVGPEDTMQFQNNDISHFEVNVIGYYYNVP